MKSSLTHVGIALSICVLTIAVYAYGYTYVANESAQAAELAATIEAKKATVDRSSVIRAALLKLGEDEARIKNYFVSEENIVAFLSELQALGQSLGTKVDIASVAASKDVSRPMLTVSLRIEGAFDALLRTIGAIEYAPYAITVTSVNISSAAGADTTLWSAAMTLEVGAMTNTASAR
jgi:hypothetical protein